MIGMMQENDETKDPVTILLIEDDEIDIRLLKRTFQKLEISNPLRIARDGQHALDVLRGRNGEEKLSPPYLILLDINMPRMNGIEFLAELRADDDLKHAIVFILTTSSAEEDRVKAYDYNIAGYILKSNSNDSFLDSIAMIDQYWKVIEFPDT